jgi:hypothetical protein
MSHELSNDADDALARLLDPSGDEEGGLGLGTSQRRGHAPSISLSKLRCLLQDRLDEAFIAPNKIPSHGK